VRGLGIYAVIELRTQLRGQRPGIQGVADIARVGTLIPECLDDYIAEDNPVRVVEAFVNWISRSSDSRA
jgi:hypothetical protein